MPRRRPTPVVLVAALAVTLGACAQTQLVVHTAKVIFKRAGPADT